MDFLPDTELFQPIEVFHDKYEIEEDVTLGEGGYSVVKLAICKYNRQAKVAVKVIARSTLERKTEEFLKREIEIMKQMDHPHIVKFFGAFADETYYYIVLEYLAGGELFDKISERVYYNESDARDIILTVLQAVKYCHDKNIIHRDLKPENLLLCSHEQDADLKLADFGFATYVDGLSLSDCCGSPEYMSPEVLTPDLNYGKPADMWSVGIILYILLGGYPPFYDTNPQNMFKLILAGNYEFHEEYWGNVSFEAKDLIECLLIKDQEARITIDEVFCHAWIERDASELANIDLSISLKAIKKAQATKRLRVAVKTVMAVNRFTKMLSSPPAPIIERPPPKTHLRAVFMKKRRGTSAMFTSLLLAAPTFKEQAATLNVETKTLTYTEGEKEGKKHTLVRCHAREIQSSDISGKEFGFALFDSRNMELMCLVATTSVERDEWVSTINSIGDNK